MGLILKGGTVVTASETLKVDVFIEDGKIAGLSEKIQSENHQVIEVEGCYVFPGGIDPHTHFDLDTGTTITADDFLTGTKAAIMGGTTTIIDFATQDKGGTLKEAVKAWYDKSKNKCYCDYGFHMAITDWNKKTSCEMEEMKGEGITSFKLYMAYKNILQVDDGAIYEALSRAKEIDVLVGFHCENGDIIDSLVNKYLEEGKIEPKYHALTRPTALEKEAIGRVINIADMVDAPIYIVHLSSKEGLEVIKEARNRGVAVYAETCPQYLLLDDQYYNGTEEDEFDGAKYVMSPPLRKDFDKEALWQGLLKGDIDTTATDHCSFNYRGQKELGRMNFSRIPNGAPGVEHRLTLLYTYGVENGEISLNKFVDITSTRAAKLFGLYPEKGSIELGSDADIIVWDPNYEGILTAAAQQQNVDYTPYEGFKYKGRVKHLFLRGTQLIKDGDFVENKPTGKYVYRK